MTRILSMMTQDLEPAVTLPWLVRLRWASIAGQLVIFPALHALIDLPLRPVWFAVVIALSAASNVALGILAPRRRWLRHELIGVVMMLDTVFLTALFFGTGGSANPFTVLYLVQIALSALVLGARWVATIVVLSLAGFAALFGVGSPHEMHMHTHLQTMWAAFAIAAALIAFFVRRVAHAITSQREQIIRLRERNERTERLASVTRLAASAAHELGSPLGTIAVAAHEATRHLEDARELVGRDLELIALEVDRCQRILERMAQQGSRSHDDAPITLGELGDELRDQLGEDRAHRLELSIAEPGVALAVPGDQLVTAVLALVENGLDASNERVEVAVRARASSVEIAVADRGQGIEPAVLERIGTPFFTTKGSGQGLGLGVFLARAFCEGCGGDLSIESHVGVGTRATIRLPVERAA